MFRFEKLDVWHRSVRFAQQVYADTRAFPDDERFGLTSQMRRAAVSISSNIAEGSGRVSRADFARFLEIAYGSLMEVVSQSKIAQMQGFLSTQAFQHLCNESEELARMLSGLRSKILQRPEKQPAQDTP
jgi:four helix bundle protein